MILGQYRFQDPYNTLGKRHWNNCNSGQVNCAGYALGTFSWWQPAKCIDWSCLYSGVRTARGRKSHLENFVKCLLDDVPNLQRISSIDEAPKGVEVIACRVGDYDFHFIRRARNGHWLHKRGGLPRIHTMTVTEVFSDNWCDGKYYGEIALFIKGTE